jgi:plastocyanin
VTFSDSGPAGGDIPDTASGSVSRTFLISGDYDYVCSIHKGMKGRVRVR